MCENSQVEKLTALKLGCPGGLNVLTLRPILPDIPRKPQLPQPTKTKWHVYKLAAKRHGEIEAVDEREAIEIAAKEVKRAVTPENADRQSGAPAAPMAPE